MASDNSKLVYGGDLMLFIGAKPLAFSQSSKLSVSMKTRDITNRDSTANFTEKVSGLYDWNVSTDGLLAFSVSGSTNSINDVYALFLSGATVNIAFASKTGTSPSYTAVATKCFTGTALITSIDISSSNGDNATYSVSLEGTGQLSIA